MNFKWKNCLERLELLQQSLEKDELLISVLGKELAEKIIKANKKEYKEYCMQVTDWEINHYLYRL